MCPTEFVGVCNWRDDFAAWQMLRQLFVASLLQLRDFTSDDEFLHDAFGFRNSIGMCMCILSLFIITKIQMQLIRILDIAFRLRPIELLHAACRFEA